MRKSTIEAIKGLSFLVVYGHTVIAFLAFSFVLFLGLLDAIRGHPRGVGKVFSSAFDGAWTLASTPTRLIIDSPISSLIILALIITIWKWVMTEDD